MYEDMVTAVVETAKEIPDRPAEILEALQLIAKGWGGIFIVIIIMMICILGLNKAFSKRK